MIRFARYGQSYREAKFLRVVATEWLTLLFWNSGDKIHTFPFFNCLGIPVTLRGRIVQWLRTIILEPDCIGLNHGSAPYQLCDFKQVAEPLWASFSLNENEDGNISACVGKFIIMRIKQIGL